MLGNLTVQIFTKFHAIFLKCTSRFLAIATEPETLMNHSRNLKTFSFMTYADTTIRRENNEIFIFKFFNLRASPKWPNLQKIEVLVKSSRYKKKYFHISRNMKTKRMLPVYEDIELCSWLLLVKYYHQLVTWKQIILDFVFFMWRFAWKLHNFFAYDKLKKVEYLSIEFVFVYSTLVDRYAMVVHSFYVLIY